MLTRISAPLFTVFFLWNAADARIYEPWNYEKLTERADAVVIGAVKSADEWAEPFDRKLLGSSEMVGQLSTFDVKAVVKGKIGGKELQLVHYNAIGRLTKVGHLEMRVFDFTPKPLTFQAGEARYLLFLKLRKDGKFEPVSGLVDSAYSVMLLKPELQSEENDQK